VNVEEVRITFVVLEFELKIDLEQHVLRGVPSPLEKFISMTLGANRGPAFARPIRANFARGVTISTSRAAHSYRTKR
jgi:hypothetical protein